MTSVIGEIPVEQFQNKFNQLFEENMVHKPDPSRNEWFSKDDPTYQTSEQVSSGNLGRVFDSMKQKSAQLVTYRGVQELNLSAGGSRLYEEEESDDYVTSDPFSKLKFDDLRKVHKDQTIFAVSEKDIDKVQQYSSVDHFMRERGKQTLTPLEKQEAEYVLAMRDKEFREKMMQKQHASNIKSMEYAEKNKTVLSSFLRLT